MSDYAKELDRHIRSAILRFAADAPSETTNVSMLEEMLPRVGLNVTRDKIETEARWLQEQGFAKVEQFQGFLTVACTQRGLDIVARKIAHPGIKKPRIGE